VDSEEDGEENQDDGQTEDDEERNDDDGKAKGDVERALRWKVVIKTKSTT